MCGIAGLIRKGPDNPTAAISSMLSVIRHRGPDDTGIYVDNIGNAAWLGLGHNRLSIIDLSARGHQPMKSPDGRYVLVYNGEVYNYLEIARELGHDDVLEISSGDAAVVLAALIKWGPQAFSRFNGMWALAFYDRARGTLLLSRDRMGIKPLYLYGDEQQLVFASEIKAVLSACGRRLTVNRKAAARYLLQSVSDAQPETFFEGVVQFPPASFAVIDLKESFKNNPAYQTFWRHPYEETPCGAGDAPPIEELRETFIDAVRLRLRSDVPVGVLLSGGVDSSSILGALGRLGVLENLHVLSVVSNDVESSEEPFIDLMAKYSGCQVDKFNADQDPVTLLDELPETCWYNDEPLGGLASVAHRNLMRIARDKGMTVLITGQGSDEQLGGYNKFLYFYLQDCFRHWRWPEAAGMLWGCVKEGTIISEFTWREAKRYLPGLAKRSGSRHWGAALNGSDLVDTSLGKSYREREWRDIRYFSIPVLLHYEDRMSMSWSREMRVPFMDYRLVELLGNIPPSSKLQAGWTKAIFRKAMEGIIPKEIQYRKDKKGFNLPIEKWIRGPLQKRFSGVFDNSMLAEDQGFINRRGMQAMYKEFLEGSSFVSYKDIFNVYCFETWLKRFEAFLDL